MVMLVIAAFGSCGAEKDDDTEYRQIRKDFIESDSELSKELTAAGFQIPEKPEPAPDFILKNLLGEETSLRASRGNFVFLNFWGLWCQYCILEMPSIQNLYDHLRNRKFQVIAIDVLDDLTSVQDFVIENAHTFPVLMDLEQIAVRRYGVRAFPTTFLIDPDGFVRAVFQGSRKWDEPEIVRLFERLLAQN